MTFVPLTLLIPIICLIILRIIKYLQSNRNYNPAGWPTKNGILIVEFARQLKSQGKKAQAPLLNLKKDLDP